MNKAIRITALLAIVLAFSLGANGGCFVRYDLEVVVPPGGSIQEAQVVVFDMKTKQREIVPWPEFAREEWLKKGR